MSAAVELRVNGRLHQIQVDPARTLLDTLRHELGLTGAKYGCGEGQCGACTVLLDGKPARACLTPISSVGPREVTTIEGLEKDGRLHPLQEAFLQEGALQCGYCTPGMILAALALLSQKSDPSENEIKSGLDGNLCRCGTYSRIVAAVRRAAEALGGGRK